MFSKRDKNTDRVKRHKRVRKNLSGTTECPRLCVYRSNASIYAQVIDDVKGITLVCASSAFGVSSPSISSINGVSTMSWLIVTSSKAISSDADANPIAKIIKSRTGNIKNFLPIIIIPK